MFAYKSLLSGFHLLSLYDFVNVDNCKMSLVDECIE